MLFQGYVIFDEAIKKRNALSCFSNILVMAIDIIFKAWGPFNCYEAPYRIWLQIPLPPKASNRDTDVLGAVSVDHQVW